VAGLPVVVADGGPARARVEAGLEAFRALFPAALCYTKIVPVDEVVTLTLHHREDDALRRLMLDAREARVLEVMTPYTEHVLPMIPAGKTYKDIITE
jgi:hypothetical protein